MSFGENLQFLRKSRNMTQEDLAESLNVSRQSVSKWESDGSFPEMDKIMQICQIFSCTMDTLVNGSVEKESAEDKIGYDKHMTSFARYNSAGIGIIIGSVAFRSFGDGFKLNDTLCNMAFLVLILVAVMLFVICGMTHENFKKNNPEITPFYKSEQVKSFESKMPVRMAVGIGLIILGFILTIGIDAMETSRLKDALDGSVFLFCVAIGVTVLTYNGMIKDKFDIEKYNNENKKEEKRKKSGSKYAKWYGIIMIIATMVFFVSGFLFEWWEYSWVAFVIGGLLCGIVGIVDKNDEE